MRPVKLTMQAFGPYAGTETIDFTELGNRTMYVISGKTGSGKTTIFDGISFAIYGKASGEDRNGPELRSQFAKEDVLTEVSLVFSLRGKTYFIKRSPQQEKKKERGEGVRMIGATAELYILDETGSEQLLASNVREVDEKIKEIILIDSNQFRQILMIPQGEFRKLLISDSKDKEVILQRLFHTEIYKYIEERLKDESTSLKKAVEEKVNLRNGLVRKITSVYNEELKGYLEAGSENDTIILPLLTDEIDQMIKQLDIFNTEVKDKEKDQEILQQKLFQAENIEKQLKQKEEAEVKKTFLEGQKLSMAAKEIEVSLAHKASLLAKQEELCHRLKRELDGYKKDLQIKELSIENLQKLLKEKEEAWFFENNREKEREIARENVHRLQQIKEEVESFATLQTEVKSLEKTLQKVNEERRAAVEGLKKTEEWLKTLLEQKQALEKTEISIIENERLIEKLNHEFEVISKFEQASNRYKDTMVTFERRKGELGQTELRLEDAKQLVNHLEQKWIHGQASIIARELQDGEACPVCGSDHHPSPAKDYLTEIPTEEDLKAAKQQVSLFEKDKSKAESAFFEVQSLVKTTEQTLTELQSEIVKQRSDFTEDNLQAFKEFVKDERNLCLQKQRELKQNQSKLEKINLELQDGEKRKESEANQVELLKEKVNKLTINYTKKDTILNGVKNRIPEELRSVQAFEKQLMHAIEKQTELQKSLELAQKGFQETKERYASEESSYVTVQKHAKEKDQELKVERELFVNQMGAQGFENYKAYEEAKRSEKQIQELEKAIRNYHEELRSATDRFNELSLLLKDVQKPDLDALHRARKEIQEQILILNDQYTNLLIKKRDNEEIRNRIQEINEEMKALEERYKLVGELSDISRGQNSQRITFERYVLAAFLDEILSVANERLSKMTSGRYFMIRKKDRAKGNVQSGLELLVFDQYTGQERHVKTLSGGESFKAALSLALGLADVVQNYAGGVSLETMFIDEGFGTLDPESLDQAVEALIDIQSSGRLVGIISHVPELRERIDARLEVSATQTGSTTQFHFLNG